MTLWLHTAIFATALTATGIASAAAYNAINDAIDGKEHRLVVSSTAPPGEYITIEQRGRGVSVLTRVAAP